MRLVTSATTLDQRMWQERRLVALANLVTRHNAAMPELVDQLHDMGDRICVLWRATPQAEDKHALEMSLAQLGGNPARMLHTTTEL